MQCLQTFWVLVGPTSGAAFSCALYRLEDGSLELRAEQDERELLLSHRFDTEAAAAVYADDWKLAAEEKGFRGFRDVVQAGG